MKARILEVDVGGRLIQTTSEHPFFVHEKGWVPADKLQLGDVLVGHDGQLTPVLRLAKTARVEDVYNIRVAEDHTYFVGEPEWNFSVWVHNAYRIQQALNGTWQVIDESNNIIHRVRVVSQEAAQKIADGWNAVTVVKAPERQHQLPTEFIEYFNRGGLEIEDFVILLGKDAHRLVKGSLHTGKGVDNWNGAWRAFFAEFPKATDSQILDHLAKLRKDFGLE